MPCEDYAALRDLKETTCANCPSGRCTCGKTDSDSDSSPTTTPSKKRKARSSTQEEPSSDVPSKEVTVPAYLLPPDTPYQLETDKLLPTARFSCQRATPLKCVNQDLCDTLEIIRRSRLLEGEDRSALSYGRAIAVIKCE